MFKNAYSLTSIDFTNFNTTKVTNMSKLFFECNKLLF